MILLTTGWLWGEARLFYFEMFLETYRPRSLGFVRRKHSKKALRSVSESLTESNIFVPIIVKFLLGVEIAGIVTGDLGVFFSFKQTPDVIAADAIGFRTFNSKSAAPKMQGAFLANRAVKSQLINQINMQTAPLLVQIPPAH